MNQDKKFHQLVKEKGIDNAISEYYPNLSIKQSAAVTRHARQLVVDGKITT